MGHVVTPTALPLGATPISDDSLARAGVGDVCLADPRGWHTVTTAATAGLGTRQPNTAATAATAATADSKWT